MLALLLLLFVCQPSKGNGLAGVDLRKKAYRGYSDRIICQVCQVLTLQMVREAKQLKSDLKKTDPNVIITEEHFINMTEDICNPFTDQGIWITFFDLVKSPPYLLLEYKEKVGKCREECETIALTCEKIKNEYEFELAETFTKKINRQEAIEGFCLPICKREKHDVKKSDKIGGQKWEEETPEHRQLFLSLLHSKQKEEDDFPLPKWYIDDFVRAEVDNKDKAKQEDVRRCIRRAKQKALDENRSRQEVARIEKEATKRCNKIQKKLDEKEKLKFKKKEEPKQSNDDTTQQQEQQEEVELVDDVKTDL